MKTSERNQLLGLSLAGLVLVGLATWGFSGFLLGMRQDGSASAETDPGEVAALATLIAAMVEMGPDPAVISTEQVDTRLPEGFPFPPMDPFIGSVSRPRSGRTVFLTPWSGERVFGFFAERLPERGWSREQSDLGDPSRGWAAWTHPDHGWVRIEAFRPSRQGPGGTSVHVISHVEPSVALPKAEPSLEDMGLPPLPPDPMHQGSSGYGQGGDRLFWSYRWESDTPSEHLLEAWTDVFHSAGWSTVEADLSPELACAALRLDRDADRYHCLLTVRTVNGTRQRISTFRMAQLTAGSP